MLGWMFTNSAMTPYQVGAGIGVLSWLTFFCSDKPIGASSFYANLAGQLGKLVAPLHTNRLKYFKENPPQKLNWETIFLVSAILGAYMAAVSAGDFGGRWLSPMWEQRFGEGTVLLRFAVAFAGGLIMAFGARLAGGCTSGHGISGSLQLALSSWLMVISLFVGGIITAKFLYGGF